MRTLVFVAASLASSVALAAPTTALQSGVATNFTLPAGQFTNDFYIDVGSESRLQLNLSTSDNSNPDIDLLLRYGSPFPDRTFTNLAPTPDYLFEHAQYRSATATGTESIDISTYNPQPVRAGRWYVSVLNFANTAVPATLTARVSNDPIPGVPIQIVFDDPGTADDPCDIQPWNDATARTPIAGNSATTLGAQRKAALVEAARLISFDVKSPVPLRVHACWEDLGTGNSVTLASAGPQGFFVRDTFINTNDDGTIASGSVMPWLPKNYTLYPSGPASKLAGNRLCLTGGCEGDYDIRIQFNSKLDGPDALGPRGFHYGLTAGPTNGDSDFISVAMHEMTHGLGFAGLINKRTEDNAPIGERAAGYDDIYDANAVRIVGSCDTVPPTCQVFPLLSGTDADRAAALTSITGLRWVEAATTASPFNPNASQVAPLNTPALYAPDPIVGGSTLSHLANALSPGNLMLPQIAATIRQLGLARPMLDAIGWSSAAAPVPATIAPFSAQYYDIARAGHGIDFSRVVGNIYTLVLYTYGANGEPEWYIAAGPLVDGVFMPAANANGDSLVKFKYVPGANPPQVADATVSGNVRLDFNGAASSTVCNDGQPRDIGNRTAIMTWSIANDRNKQWCMQPLIPDGARTTPDWTGGWASSTASDSGWGFSLIGFGPAFSGLVYYPDAQGNGRWAYVQTANFASGTEYNLFERRGYCRTCALPASVANGQFDDVQAGKITINLTQPNAGTNRAKFNVTYQRDAGGSFTRDTTIVPLTETRQ